MSEPSDDDVQWAILRISELEQERDRLNEYCNSWQSLNSDLEKIEVGLRKQLQARDEALEKAKNFAKYVNEKLQIIDDENPNHEWTCEYAQKTIRAIEAAKGERVLNVKLNRVGRSKPIPTDEDC